MEFKFSFRHIIAHIIPGVLLSIELLLFLYLVSPMPISKNVLFSNNTAMVIFFLIIGGIFFGILLDAFQHCLFEDLQGTKFLSKVFSRMRLPISYKDIERRKNFSKISIKTRDQLIIYDYLVNELYYFYYEAWINLALSLIPLFGVLPFLFIKWLIPIPWLIISLIISFICIFVLLYEGIVTYYDYSEEEREILEGFKK